jgi:hypothetical protein
MAAGQAEPPSSITLLLPLGVTITLGYPMGLETRPGAGVTVSDLRIGVTISDDRVGVDVADSRVGVSVL